MKFGTVKDYMKEESRKLKKEKKKKWWNFDHRTTTSSCISAGDSADGKTTLDEYSLLKNLERELDISI